MIPMNLRMILFCLGCIATPVRATETASLIRQAIVNGQAAAVVEGDVASEARRWLNATGPLTVRVTRLVAYQQPGCARVRLDFVQGQGLLPGATVPADVNWSTAMNICVDGQAPSNLRKGRP